MRSIIHVVGNLTAAPVKTDLPNGGIVVNFNIVFQERAYNEETKEWKDSGDPSFYRCSVWNKRAQNMINSQNLVPGTTLMVSGKHFSQSYIDKKTGEKRISSNNIKVEEVGVSFSNTPVSLPLREKKEYPNNNSGGGFNNGGGYNGNNNGGGGFNNGNSNAGNGNWNAPAADPWASAANNNGGQGQYGSSPVADEPPF